MQKKKETVHYGNSPSGATNSKTRWFQASKQDVPTILFEHARRIKNKQIRNRMHLKEWEMLYNNFAGLYLQLEHLTLPHIPAQSLSLNVIKSCVDTHTAKLAKSPARCLVLPENGDDKLSRIADNLTKYLDGAKELANLSNNRELAIWSGDIYGTGYIHHFIEDDRLKSRTVFPDEVLIEYLDGVYDNTEEGIEWGYEHLYDKDVLKARYPDLKEQIEASSRSWIGEQSYIIELNKVCVVEYYRRNSFPGSNDGVHRKVIKNAVLEYDDYHFDKLPIETYFFTPPTSGPFGSSICAALSGKQMVISSLMNSFTKSCHEFAVPRIIVPKSAGLSPNTIRDDVSIHLVNDTTGILFSLPQAIANGAFEYLQWVYQSSFADIGLSQMSTSSQKPPGLNAAVAMDTFHDIETERFAIDALRAQRQQIRGSQI